MFLHLSEKIETSRLPANCSTLTWAPVEYKARHIILLIPSSMIALSFYVLKSDLYKDDNIL